MTWRHLAVGCVTIMTVYVALSGGCHCPPKHPQTLFCESEFVILAKILTRRVVGIGGTLDQNHSYRYSVKIMRIFKGSKGLRRLSREEKGRFVVNVAATSSMCGVDPLPLGSKYVLSSGGGDDNWVNGCGIVVNWSALSRNEKKYYSKKYPRNCKCQIHVCGLGQMPIAECAILRHKGLDRAVIGGLCVCDSYWNGAYCYRRGRGTDKTCHWSENQIEIL